MAMLSTIFDDELHLIDVLAYSLIFTSIIVFFVLPIIKAPYGRYANPKWGPSIGARLGWFIQELPAFIVPLWMLVWSCLDGVPLGSNHIVLLLFIFHYFQRSLIFPLLIRGGKPSPWVTVSIAFAFCCYNGYMQSRHLILTAAPGFQACFQPHFIIGVVLFIAGAAINIHADYILRNLRKPGESGYKIPRGGLFDYVSGANFLGEIIEWLGFAVTAWNLPALAFELFVICNLSPRAYTHHKWYQQKFENYPKERKALIPLII